MARNSRIRDNLPPWPATTRAGAILVITGAFLVYLYVNQQHALAPKSPEQPAETAARSSPAEVVGQQSSGRELARSAAAPRRATQTGPVDPFDLSPPMQPLSAPAPRHRSEQANDTQENSLPEPAFRADGVISDQLRMESLDLQQRLEAFSSQWKKAHNEASEKFFRGELPELDAEDHAIDQRFAEMYGALLAPEISAEKAKLLRSLPGIESHKNYEHANNLDQLMDIDRDFTELRTVYLRKALTTGQPTGLPK